MDLTENEIDSVAALEKMSDLNLLMLAKNKIADLSTLVSACQADADRATSKAWRASSMWRSVWVAITEVRSRAFLGATAGARAQFVYTPWSSSERQMRAASQSSPMCTGTMAVSVSGPTSKPSWRSPVRS